MVHCKSKRIIVIYSIFIVSILYINATPIQTNIMNGTNSTIGIPTAGQAWGEGGNSFHNGSIENERDAIIRYSEKIVKDSLEKYDAINNTNSNTTNTNSNKRVKRDSREEEQKKIDMNIAHYKNILANFEADFVSITGESAENLYNNWRNPDSRSIIDSYQTVVFENYFEDLIKAFTISEESEENPSSELNNKVKKRARITNIPVLSARVYEYYPYVKEDFKDIIRNHYKPMNPDSSEIDPFEGNIISEEQLANMFLDVVESPGIYKKYDFSNVIMYESAEEYINKTVNYDKPEEIPEALNNLKDNIKDVQINLTKYIGEVSDQIKKYIEGTPKFHIKDKIIHTTFQYGGNPADLRMYDGKDPQLITSEVKSMWRITNGCFIKQMHKIIKLVQRISKKEESYGFKNYLHKYTHQYFLTNKKAYFKTVKGEIKDLERRILDFYDTPNDEHDINEMNSMSKELEYLATNTTELLDITIKNFKTGLEKVEGYNTLTNKTNLPSKDSTEFKKAKHKIEYYVGLIWKIAKYADEHIGLTKEEKSLDNDLYNETLAENPSYNETLAENPSYNETLAENPSSDETSSDGLFDTPSYINKSSQVSFNPLLAISAAGTYILKILFFR